MQSSAEAEVVCSSAVADTIAAVASVSVVIALWLQINMYNFSLFFRLIFTILDK